MSLLRPTRNDRRRTRAFLLLATPCSVVLAIAMRVIEHLLSHDGFFDRRLFGFFFLGVLALTVGYCAMRVMRQLEWGLSAWALVWVGWFVMAIQTGMFTGG